MLASNIRMDIEELECEYEKHSQFDTSCGKRVEVHSLCIAGKVLSLFSVLDHFTHPERVTRLCNSLQDHMRRLRLDVEELELCGA